MVPPASACQSPWGTEQTENVTEGCVSCPVFMGLEILKKNAFFTGQGEGEAGGRHLLW